MQPKGPGLDVTKVPVHTCMQVFALAASSVVEKHTKHSRLNLQLLCQSI